jgi:hypothetical protein
MIRITFLELALIATPFVLFFLYRAAVGTRRTQSGDAVDETPYQILFLTGSAVALAALVAAVLLGRDSPDPAVSRDQVYVPPRVVDGELQAGFFVTREEAIARGLIVSRGDGGFAPQWANGTSNGTNGDSNEEPPPS